jgi:hypothetical protein
MAQSAFFPQVVQACSSRFAAHEDFPQAEKGRPMERAINLREVGPMSSRLNVADLDQRDAQFE